jgi:elongation factor Ts
MNKTEMIRELRELTQAGMNDCKEAMENCQGDLQKAIDYIKTKGLNIADGRSGRAASEGVVCLGPVSAGMASLVEVNCQTDFVANSPDFHKFCSVVKEQLGLDISHNKCVFQHNCDRIENARKELVATTKENIVVRRWWIEQSFTVNARVFHYVHSNNKIGVLLTVLAPSSEVEDSPIFTELGDNLAMQIAAMNPLAVSVDRLSADDVDRQSEIFQTQLKEMNKPQAAWAKISEGKFRKWHTEVCLLEQECVWLPKTTVKQAVANVGTALGGEIKIVNFVRCQVGEGVITKKDNLAEEVAKLM